MAGFRWRKSSDTATGETPVADQDEALHEWLSALPAGKSTNPEEIPLYLVVLPLPVQIRMKRFRLAMPRCLRKTVRPFREKCPAQSTDENLVEIR